MASNITTYSANLPPPPSTYLSRPTVDRPTRFFGLTPPSLQPFAALPAGAAKSYDPRIAYLTAVVSAWAYSDGQTMANQLAYYGLPRCSVREFTVVNDAMLVVAAAYLVRSEDGRV